MKKRMFAAAFSSAMLLANATAIPSQAQNDNLTIPALSEKQSAALSYAIAELGFSDVNSFVQQTQIMTETYDSSDYIDLTGDGNLDTDDVIYLLDFLEGKVDYPYDYNDLDPTGDCIIDKADAQAILSCFLYYTFFPELSFSPGTHSTTLAPTQAHENRSYIRHAYSDGSNPSSNDLYYTLYASDLQSTPSTHEIRAESGNNRDGVYTVVQSSRVARCSGTGSIVGEHLILTAAHCVYSSPSASTRQYNTTAAVTVFTYDESGNPTPHNLTIKYYHIPQSYYYANTGSDGFPYDFALIEVQENLYDLGYDHFDLGVCVGSGTGGAAALNTVVYKEGFPSVEECYYYPNYPNTSGAYRFYSVLNTGVLSGMSNYSINTTLESIAGSSGSGVYTKTSWNSNTFDTVIGLCTKSNGSGPKITLPVLHFIYNNSNLYY